MNRYHCPTSISSYLYAHRKNYMPDRYIVSKIDGEWCFLKKFAGAQLRAQSYKVKKAECYLGPAALPPRRHLYPPALATLGNGDEETYLEQLTYLKRTNFLHPMSHHRLPPTYCDPTSLHQVTLPMIQRTSHLIMNKLFQLKFLQQSQ